MYNLNLDDFPSGLPEEVMSILKPKKHRRYSLVEHSFVLNLHSLGKGLLRVSGKDDKTGSVILSNRFTDLLAKFSVTSGDGKTMLTISCKHRNSILKQMIQIQQSLIRFGMRPYLSCACGYRGNKLYLSSREYSFLCRQCAGLYYEATTINRKSSIGALKYQLARKFKIAMLQEQVKRVSYQGMFTKKARRVMQLVGAVKV